MNKYGYTKIEVLIIAVLLGIVAFITINCTSYAFEIDKSQNISEIKNLLASQAKEYAMDHLEIFAESDTTFISVNDLIEEGYMRGNDKGLIIDPLDSSKNFNDKKIKLEYNEEENQVESTFID